MARSFTTFPSRSARPQTSARPSEPVVIDYAAPTPQALAERDGVPPEVAEFCVALSEDFLDPTHWRVGRMGDDLSLRRYYKQEKAGTVRAGTEPYGERFYWGGVGYVVGFTHRGQR